MERNSQPLQKEYKTPETEWTPPRNYKENHTMEGGGSKEFQPKRPSNPYLFLLPQLAPTQYTDEQPQEPFPFPPHSFAICSFDSEHLRYPPLSTNPHGSLQSAATAANEHTELPSKTAGSSAQSIPAILAPTNNIQRTSFRCAEPLVQKIKIKNIKNNYVNKQYNKKTSNKKQTIKRYN
jgi:hypothetical protein